MKNVVITGVGIKSCIGNTYKDVLSNLQNGKSGIAFNDTYSEMGFRSCVSGSIDVNLSDFIDRKLLRFMGESAGYAYLATADALEMAGIDEEDLDYSYDIWTSYIDGVSAIDTSSGINPPVVVGYVNYGNVNMGGLDMSLSIFLSKKWNLDLNYSFLSMSSFINPITNVKDPVNAPKNKGNLKLQYTNSNGKFNSSLSLRYVEKFPWQSGVYFGTIGPYLSLIHI